jgi:sugar phosphate isomerase/epimerase
LQTTAELLVPPLRLLEDMFAARLESASHKAQTQLDELLETLGESPTVEVYLELHGRLVRTAAELDRLLAESRDRVGRELDARHRVRLK